MTFEIQSLLINTLFDKIMPILDHNGNPISNSIENEKPKSGWKNIRSIVLGIGAAIGFLAVLFQNFDVLKNYFWPSEPPSTVDIVEIQLNSGSLFWQDVTGEMETYLADLDEFKGSSEYANFEYGEDIYFKFKSSYLNRGNVNEYAFRNLAAFPDPLFVAKSEFLFCWEQELDDHGNARERSPLVLNVGLRNNSSRQLSVTKVTLRVLESELHNTSGGGAVGLVPEKFIIPAVRIECEWPVNPSVLFNEHYGTLPDAIEDIALINPPLLISGGEIERFHVVIPVPKMPCLGRHNALVELDFMTSEGGVSTGVICISTDEW